MGEQADAGKQRSAGASDLSLKGILHNKDRRFKCAVRAEGPSQYQPGPVRGAARAEPMTGPGYRCKPIVGGRRSAQITEAIAPGDLRRPTACGPGRRRGPGPLRAFSPKADRAGIGAGLRPAEFCPMMHVNLRCRSGISGSKLSSGAWSLTLHEPTTTILYVHDSGSLVHILGSRRNIHRVYLIHGAT
jgi:hypothetical protein